MTDEMIKNAKEKMNSVKKEILDKQDELNNLITEYQRLYDEVYNE